MATFYDSKNDFRNYLQHYGVKGMRWRNRRASSRNVDDQRNRHRVNLSEGSSWNANGTDRRHRRNDSDQESPETGRQNGHYYNRNSWLQRQHDETVHDHDPRVVKGRAQDEERNRALNKAVRRGFMKDPYLPPEYRGYGLNRPGSHVRVVSNLDYGTNDPGAVKDSHKRRERRSSGLYKQSNRRR